MSNFFGKCPTFLGNVQLFSTFTVTHLDWSTDGEYVVANSQAYEIFWVSSSSYSRITASSAKDIDWYTWTCVLGFPVIGIWPGVDMTDVNTCCISFNRSILATGEDSSKVKLFKYPCYVEKAKFKEYFGHSSHLTEVKFTIGDNYLVTVAGNDKTVIVWSTDFGKDTGDDEDEEDPEIYQDEDGDIDIAKGDFDSDDDVGAVKQKKFEQKTTRQITKVEKPVDELGLFEEEDAGGGDEFMAVKPWMGQMREPSEFRKAPKNQEQPPTIKFDLEWVHGYRARDSKNNIAILKDGWIAYHAAAVGIIYDSDDHSQKHFNKHIDDITSIAFSSDERTIATGEIGPKPSIYVWDGWTMLEIIQIKGKLKKGIQALSFSPSGSYLAGWAIDTDHHVAVFNSKTGDCLAMDKGDGNMIVDIWMKNDNEFVTVGVRHFKEWSLNNGVLKSNRGKFGKSNFSNMIVSWKFYKNTCITGTLKGKVLIWNGTTISKGISGKHDGPVDSLYVWNDNTVVRKKNDTVCKKNEPCAKKMTPCAKKWPLCKKNDPLCKKNEPR